MTAAMAGHGCSKVLQRVPKRCEEVPFNASLTADFLDGHAGRPKSHLHRPGIPLDTHLGTIP